MRTEKGVILAVWKNSNRNPRFLVLKRKKNWEGWELVKGHLEGEEEETAMTELEEEAGIGEDQVEELKDLDSTVEWSFEDDGEKVKREYRAFMARVEEDAVPDVDGNPHDEHEKALFLSYEDASALLTYEDQDEILEEVRERID
ncbi:MAG: NUDIX domain-containing protein [Candidatus Nanohaloarchaea archaeon]